MRWQIVLPDDGGLRAGKRIEDNETDMLPLRNSFSLSRHMLPIILME
jgi:hypothetical protein